MIRSILLFIGFGLAVWAAAHAVLRRRDPRAALWWVAITLALPIVGAALYYLFGINRIRRRRLFRSFRENRSLDCFSPVRDDVSLFPHLARLADVVGRLSAAPLSYGNRVTILRTAEEAYAAMLAAINAAKTTIGLDMYIFNDDEAGHRFVEALVRAKRRGVKVYVLLDEVGSRYSRRSAFKALRANGIPVAYFLPSLSPWRLRYLNLRNHRKILTVDGQIGFTGGMNIHASHLVESGTHMTKDLHFKVEGPVVAQIQETFRDDWSFTTGEILDEKDWFPESKPIGETILRSISDGPDHDFEKGQWTILSAIDLAQHSIQIVTPYFVPDTVLITALGLAVLKGVRVDIVLPEFNDLPLVHWASRATLWQVLERGCHVWASPRPFDHSKLMTIDRGWALVGSSNWDTRSFRLNFELNLECYDPALASELAQVVNNKIANSREITLSEMDGRVLPVKLRDGVARLFAPHL